MPYRPTDGRRPVPLNTPALAHGYDMITHMLRRSRTARSSVYARRPQRVYTFTALTPATASSLRTHHGAPLPSRLHFFVRSATAQAHKMMPDADASLDEPRCRPRATRS
jgi:hypothetical protein